MKPTQYIYATLILTALTLVPLSADACGLGSQGGDDNVVGDVKNKEKKGPEAWKASYRFFKYKDPITGEEEYQEVELGPNPYAYFGYLTFPISSSFGGNSYSAGRRGH